MSTDFISSLTSFLTTLDSLLGSAVWFPFLLLGTGIFFTIYLGFPQLRFFSHAVAILRGKFDQGEAKGDASHFQALSTAIALQREGRQQFMTAEELEERNDRSGARDMYQQSIVALKSATRYLIDLRTEKNDAHAKSLTERRSQEFESGF